MRVCGIYLGASKGATMYEVQVGRLWGVVLLPRFWRKRNWPFVRLGWQANEREN